tara:strand:- start:546 stop:1127 length:582 start_codon:yes stop_codon:yes gene_type:complete
MPFWSENFGQPGLKDPKRNFRWTIEFQGIQSAQGGALLWYAKTADKPSFSLEAAEAKYLNHTFYYPGSVSWQDVNVVLTDPVDPDVTATLSDIVVQSGYNPPTDANSLTTMSKSKSANSLGAVIITQIDADGNPLETWTLANAWIKEVKFSSLEYGNDDLSEATVTLKYDWATVTTANPSVAVAGGGNTFFKS